MSRNTNNTNSNAYVAMVKAIAAYSGGKGMPTWKRISGTDKATVTAFLSDSATDLSQTMDEWSDHKGPLSKLPSALLTEAIMSAIIASDDVSRMAELKTAFVAAQSGQVTDSGDKILNGCNSAGTQAGERIAILTAALRILQTAIPVQVKGAGADRIAAYVSARDAAASAQAPVANVIKMVGTVVNGNSALAETYGKGGDFPADLFI